MSYTALFLPSLTQRSAVLGDWIEREEVEDLATRKPLNTDHRRFRKDLTVQFKETSVGFFG